MTAKITSKTIHIKGDNREDVVAVIEQFQKDNTDLYISSLYCNSNNMYDHKTGKHTEEVVWSGSCTVTASKDMSDMATLQY